MKKLLVAGAALAVLSFGGAASAAVFPGIGADSNGPGLLITLASNGTASIAVNPACGTACGPYDNAEDTYIGVVNNSGHAVTSLDLSAASAIGIFGFDGDGIAGYAGSGGGNASDSTGYGGPHGFFSNIHSAGGIDFGTVNFTGGGQSGGIANGGTDYFSLEEPLTAASFTGITVSGGVPEPTSWAMMIVGFFGLGSLLRRRRQDVAAVA